METATTDKDLVVDVTASEVRIALMENHRLIELDRQSTKSHGFTVGDVYLGKVKKLLPALNAAFVDIGDSKEAFVHYLDLGMYFNAFDTFVKESNPNNLNTPVFTLLFLYKIKTVQRSAHYPCLSIACFG